MRTLLQAALLYERLYWQRYLRILLYMCPHTVMSVLILPCMCPHAATYVSSYCCMCVLILLCMCQVIRVVELVLGAIFENAIHRVLNIYSDICTGDQYGRAGTGSDL
jgi:hypothetical protein